MLEERGFSTVALASVRAQAEKTRPPRALWSAAALGRPLGIPEDAGYQTRMIRAALALLERTDGPVILEDYQDDPPAGDNPAWTPPALPSARGFAAELKVLMPWWAQARLRFGRTTVGLSGIPPDDWPAMTASLLNGALPTTPLLDTPALALRFLCDDIKALYGEAAQAIGPAPSPGQVDSWFWRQTAAGALLQALRTTAMSSENNGVKTVGGRFLVPAPWVV